MTRRRAVALALVLSVFATACSAGDAAAPLITTTTAGSADGANGVMWLFEPVFEQVDCPDHLDREGLACGTAELLLDEDDLEAGTTEISLATLAGSDATAGAMAVLQGGPGGASTDLAAWLPQQSYTQVFIDQRGTGFAGAEFDCPEFDAVLPSLLEIPIDDVEATEAEALASCADRLAGEPLLDHADSAIHADDVTTVMLGLGHVHEWYAYGVSYGSTIAMELLREPRPGLAGVVLDGVYPVTLDLDRAVGVSAQSSVDAIARACAADEGCDSGGADFATLLDDLVARLDAAPITVAVGRSDSGFGRELDVRLDGARLADLVFILLYSERNVAGLPAALAGLAAGDAGAAEWLAANGSRTLASAYAANDEGTYFAVQCAERVAAASGIDRSIGGFAGAIVTTSFADACAQWPVTSNQPTTSIESDVPTLLLSGEFDPITPPAYADLMAETLTNATVVTQSGRSHGIWIGDECIQGIVRAFVEGDAAAPDVGCAGTPVPVDWFTPG